MLDLASAKGLISNEMMALNHTPHTKAGLFTVPTFDQA